MPDNKEKLVWCMNDLEEEPIDWLWPVRLPGGKLTMIDGDPGQGKSLMTLDLASRLTTARPLPDGFTPQGPLSVVLIGSEDGIRDTVLPRLRAAGADLSRVHVFAGRAQAGVWRGLPVFPDDCDLLTDTLRQTGARLVIVDPLMAFLSPRVCSLNYQMVIHALGSLAQVAADLRAAIILVRHLTKWGRGGLALHRGIGSPGLVGTARMAYLVGAAPADEDLHVLACTKTNLLTRPSSLSFRIAANDQGQPVIDWAGPVDVTADELVLAPGRDSSQALARAKEFLEQQLRQGPLPREELSQRAQEAGHSDTTLRRAKSRLRVLAEQKWIDGKNCWFWRLPASPATDQTALLARAARARPRPGPKRKRRPHGQHSRQIRPPTCR